MKVTVNQTVLILCDTLRCTLSPLWSHPCITMNLLKTLAKVSSMTMVSRILGFIRDAIIARMFGAGMATDAFFVAFKLPNLLRRIFAEGAFSQAFVPILADRKSVV